MFQKVPIYAEVPVAFMDFFLTIGDKTFCTIDLVSMFALRPHMIAALCGCMMLVKY